MARRARAGGHDPWHPRTVHAILHPFRCDAMPCPCRCQTWGCIAADRLRPEVVLASRSVSIDLAKSSPSGLVYSIETDAMCCHRLDNPPAAIVHPHWSWRVATLSSDDTASVVEPRQLTNSSDASARSTQSLVSPMSHCRTELPVKLRWLRLSSRAHSHIIYLPARSCSATGLGLSSQHVVEYRTAV